MADIKQCDLCRMPFQSLGSKICPKCLDKIEDDLVVIRDYLYDNPGNIGTEKLAKDTGVSRKAIAHLIETGRLEFRQNISTGYCSVCREPIYSGTLCEKCAAKVMEDMNKTLPTPPAQEKKKTSERPGGKMHIDREK